MFIPTVPRTTHTTIVNKTIVYSDTVLKLDELGSTLKLTTINDLKEDDLEKCLKTIFESNPDVTFNTIQYSKNKKKLYIYADKEPNILNWKNRNVRELKPLSNNQEIIEELSYVFDSSNNPKDEDIISVSDVAYLMKKTRNAECRISEIYENRIESILKNKLCEYTSVFSTSYDYQESELTLEYKYINEKRTIKFKRNEENNDIFISSSDTYQAETIFSYISRELSKLFDEYEKFRDFNDFNQYNYKINSVNSSFNVSISIFSVDIFTATGKYIQNKIFEITSPNLLGKREVNCNSSIVLDLVRGNESKIQQNVFIKIEDCPKWMRNILYETRKQQLEELAKKEEKQKREEEKQETIRRIKRFFNPFAK